MNARLVRELDDGHCTIGRFYLPARQTFFTLERPWLGNQRGVSCFPTPGTYHAIIRRSPHLGITYWLHDVPDRSFILIHSGNVVAHVQGCIALGLMRGWLRGERAVFQSVTAVRNFMKLMGGQPFTLEVM
jgi:hypothetical protein